MEQEGSKGGCVLLPLPHAATQKGERETEFVSTPYLPPLLVKKLVVGCLIWGQEEPRHPSKCFHTFHPVSALSELLGEEKGDPQNRTQCMWRAVGEGVKTVNFHGSASSKLSAGHLGNILSVQVSSSSQPLELGMLQGQASHPVLVFR